jgi:hypothetical protein
MTNYQFQTFGIRHWELRIYFVSSVSIVLMESRAIAM